VCVCVPALVEGVDLHPVVFVLLEDFLGVVVGVERIHENQRNVSVEGFIKMLEEEEEEEFSLTIVIIIILINNIYIYNEGVF